MENSETRQSKAAMEIKMDRNGIDQVILRNPRGALAVVSLFGGQVTSWRNEQGEERLFTSHKPVLANPQAICGGIPICFPEFGACGSVDQHGFVRRKMWIIDEDPPAKHPNDSYDESFIDLLLKPADEDLRRWPHRFELRLRVSLGAQGDLTLTSRVKNIDGKPFNFNFAYHSHLIVSDIGEVRIEGLEALDYFDNLRRKDRFTEQGDAITFESEIDRVYLDSPRVVAILDHEKKQTYVIKKDGLPDVGVWNPWEKKAKTLPGIVVGEYRKMVWFDGAVRERPIKLRPGEEWIGRMELQVAPSSFYSKPLDHEMGCY